MKETLLFAKCIRLDTLAAPLATTFEILFFSLRIEIKKTRIKISSKWKIKLNHSVQYILRKLKTIFIYIKTKF